jgi:diamine N-acetyltransferase
MIKLGNDASLTDVKSSTDIEIIINLSNEIWRDHYTPIIGADQVEYMLDNMLSAKSITDQIEQDSYSYFLLKYRKTNSGYLSFKPNKEGLFLSKIYIKSKLRDKGIGKMLLKFMENRALSQGLNFIYLYVNKNNTSSVEAYKKWGFEIIDSLVREIGNGFVMDDYKMQKTL